MNRVLGLFLALFAIISTLAGTTTFYGKVTDPEGKPVGGAVISDGLMQVFSGEDGSFYFSTTADSLYIRRLGFQPRAVPRTEMIRPIVLQPQPVTLPKVVVSESAWDFLAAPADRVTLPLDPDRHYYSAGEILSSTPAVRSNDVPLKGESQGVSILGNLARHSLVILDGVPLNPDGESCDLSLIDPANIEKIELIKNNASVYGGGSAIGGIVRITSKKGAQAGGESFSLATELGSFGYAKNSFMFANTLQDWKLRLNVSNLNTDNDFRYKIRNWWSSDSTAVRENNAKRQNSLSASAGTRFGKTNINLQTDYTSFYRQLPGTVNFLDVYKNAFLKGYASRNRISADAQLWDWDAQVLAWGNLDGTLYDNTRAPLAVYLSKYRQSLMNSGLRGSLAREFPLPHDLKYSAAMAAEAGISQYKNSDLLHENQDLDAFSRFANASLKSGLELDRGEFSWTGSAALRYDRNDQENNLSWRLEGSLRHYGRMETTLGGTLGTAFALPSPYDLYWRGDSQAWGNPDLASETSRGWQVWLENRLGAFTLKSTFHRNEIKNLIQWRQIQMFGNVWKPVNIGKARIQNIELELGFRPLDWLDLSGSALFTKGLDLSAEPISAAPELMYTPDVNYAADMQFSWRKVKFWGRYSYTGRQFTTPDNLADPLPAYALLDARVDWSVEFLNWKLIPQFSVRNLLGKRYEVYAYVPQPGIAFYGGLSLQLNN